jgi:hypothetical protein
LAVVEQLNEIESMKATYNEYHAYTWYEKILIVSLAVSNQTVVGSVVSIYGIMCGILSYAPKKFSNVEIYSKLAQT